MSPDLQQRINAERDQERGGCRVTFLRREKAVHQLDKTVSGEDGDKRQEREGVLSVGYWN